MKKFLAFLSVPALIFLSCAQSTSDNTGPAVVLSGLSLSSGALTPAFDSGVTSYTQAVTFSTSSTAVTAATANSAFAVSVKGTPLTLAQSGSEFSGTSGAIALAVGANDIPVAVAYGGETTIYAVTLTRGPAVVLSGLSLSSGALTPAFDSGVTSYTQAVPYSTSSTAVTAATANSAFSVSVKGTPLTLAQSGSEFSGTSGAIALAVGANDIPVAVGYGGETTTYAVTLTRDGIPNIQVTGPTIYGGAVTTLGSGALIDFGHVTLTPRDITFTIESTGAGSLRLTGTSPNYVTVSGSSVYSIPAQPAESTIPSGQNQTFVIRFTTNQSWATETTTVTVLNDDIEDGTFTLSLSGIAEC